MDEPRVFAVFPILKTPRLVLRELRDDDVMEAHRIFSDEEAVRYLGRLPHTELEKTREYLERNRAQFPNREGIRWAITLAGQDRFIGSCGHWRLIKEHHRSEIGYDLLRQYWGQGIMAEALRAILRFGFEEMELHATEAQIDPENLRSQKVLERLGFRQDGLIRENYFALGKFLDTAIFTLLRREYAVGS